MTTSYYRGLTGEVIIPGDPEYEEARQEWNRAIQKYPLVIVYCYNRYDVRNAICWARANNIGIRIRSGGHNYEGYSVGNQVLVLDISRMNALKLDTINQMLFVEGGVKNRQVYQVAGSAGYPFPSGTCPTVGVSGITTGGGWGYSCRYFGLVCDNLLELELVDYTGKVIVANGYRNKDLFWACRGAGGGNFGVITGMTFKVPPRVNKVTLFELYYPHTSAESQVEFLNTWQKWLPYLDNKMGLQATIYNSLEEGIATYSRGLFYGPPAQARSLLQPFADIGGVTITLQYLTFLEAITQVEESYPSSEMFKSTGRFVLRQFCREELEGIVDLIKDRPEGSVLTSVGVYALGGAVQDVGKHDTAFYYRDAQYIMNIQSVWENPQNAPENVTWVEERFRYLKSVTRGSYVNFPFSGLKHYEEAYFGGNVARLQQVKSKYDPYDVFAFPQGLK